MNEELLASIEREILGWPGVRKASSPGGAGRGGYRVPPFTSYTLGRREIGHIHDNGVADLTFTRALHDKLISEGRAIAHGAGFPGVVSYRIRGPEDVPRTVELFRMNYDRLQAYEEKSIS
jgi:Luciferase